MLGQWAWEKTRSLNKEIPNSFDLRRVGDFIILKDIVSQISYNLSYHTKIKGCDSLCTKIIPQWKRP